ncbi:MAG: Ycf51 family protein [Cyanobacteriota bacterium]|nr:Ycf51 family protein [Cyanobacteriota bacterium]
MITNAGILTASQVGAILTVICGAIATLAFIFNWGIKFRLVGITAFMGVLTGGLLGLGLGLYTRTAIPGALPYSVVYDNGGNKSVVAIQPEVTKSELEATIQQVAADLFSPGRFGSGDNELTIKVRTVIHPETGVSEPVYLGEVKRSLATRDDENMEITIFSDRLEHIQKFSS